MMPKETVNFTKDDFLNYRKLAEKLGADPDAVYETMRRHYKGQTPIKYISKGTTITTAMIVNRKHAKSPEPTRKLNLLLHPMGIAAFKESFNKGK